ncbi:hypothetical protein MNBD_GAMMA12-1611 [hydrothermal vent metagenome]|uniref:General secretion pathway GspH domain-containing protein n=1 Tax=hydrothermal vent metagenome TaxID=652676 RepID=A0A3B0ZMC0_9ZZZZ
MRTTPNITGFSLIELLLTLTIISIISVFALPNFGNLTDIRRLKSAVRDLQTSINLTRSLAIRQGTTITLCIKNRLSTSPQCSPSGQAQGNWASGWLIFRDLNNNRQRDKNEPLLSNNTAVKFIGIQSNSQKSLVQITALGASILSNQTWEFCLNGKRESRGFQLILSSPGQIRPVKINSC